MLREIRFYKITNMTRRILLDENVHANIQEKMGGGYSIVIDEVIAATRAHSVVVVGMKQNPFVKKARQLLQQQGVEFHYLEYGSYFKLWRRRNALKMWTGWPSFPMIFINGVLIGGSSDLRALVETDSLNKLL